MTETPGQKDDPLAELNRLAAKAQGAPNEIWAWEIDHAHFPSGYYALREVDAGTRYVRGDTIDGLMKELGEYKVAAKYEASYANQLLDECNRLKELVRTAMIDAGHSRRAIEDAIRARTEG